MSIEETLAQILTEVKSLRIQPREADRLLKAREAGELLQVTAKFLYDHASDYPFTVWLTNGDRKTVRFSYNGIMKYIDRKLKLQEK